MCKPGKWRSAKKIIALGMCVIFSMTGCSKNISDLLPWGDKSEAGKEETAENSTEEQDIGEIRYQQVEQDHIAENDDGLMYVDNEILIVAEENTTYEEIETISQKYDMEIVGWIELTGDYQLKLAHQVSETELNEIIEKVKMEAGVKDAYVNACFQMENQFFNNEIAGFNYGDDWKWNLGLMDWKNCSGTSWGLEAINTFQAWELLDQNKNVVSPVRVGLIDNYFDEEHEDLEFAETFYNEHGKLENNETGHGTHVAGTFAANAQNKKGICGVYPYGEGNLYGVSYCGISSYSENGDFRVNAMGLKIAYAELILRNVKVINNSMAFNHYRSFKSEEGTEWLQEVEKIKKYAYTLGEFLNRFVEKGYDYVLIISAGNDSDRLNGVVFDAKYSWWLPAIEEDDWPEVYKRIIVVGSYGSSYNVSNFSNGGTRVDVFGPGEKVYSTVPNDDYENQCVKKPGLIKVMDEWSGTSMAAPHVAGVAAMVWAANGDLTGAQVKSIVCESKNNDRNGLINAEEAVSKALNKQTEVTNNWGNEGAILCWVVNKENEEKVVAGAEITAINVDTEAEYHGYTGEEGHFEMLLPAGRYYLEVTAKGYEDYRWPGDRADYEQVIQVETGQVNYLADWIKMVPKKTLVIALPKFDFSEWNPSSSEKEALPEDTIRELQRYSEEGNIQGIMECYDPNLIKSIYGKMNIALKIASVLTGEDRNITIEEVMNLLPEEVCSILSPYSHTEITKTVIKGKKATVYITDNLSGLKTYLSMKKMNGKWYIMKYEAPIDEKHADQVLYPED